MALILKASDCLGGERSRCFVTGFIEIRSFFLLASNMPKLGIDNELPLSISSFRTFTKEEKSASDVSESI